MRFRLIAIALTALLGAASVFTYWTFHFSRAPLPAGRQYTCELAPCEVPHDLRLQVFSVVVLAAAILAIVLLLVRCRRYR